MGQTTQGSRRQYPFLPAELPVSQTGRIYHLDLLPEEVATHLIVVGDPDRVPMLANAHLARVEIDHIHRGLRTITGEAKVTGQRVSIVTSGMGTPSLEIVLQELVALHEVDLKTLMPKETVQPLSVIRVGTSGGLQLETPTCLPIVTHYAVGLDNTGLFYAADAHDPHCVRIEEELHDLLAESHTQGSRFQCRIWPYVAMADAELADRMERTAGELGVAVKQGITASSSGFFSNQGRWVSNIPPFLSGIEELLADYSPGVGSLRIENMEMECSFLFHFMNSLSHRAACICPTIANRRSGTFASRAEIEASIHIATEIAIRTLAEPVLTRG